ncbi:MAG: hypothetical protein IKP95_09540 [Ruminococcus sp.]|nr:hypothetical protein [Ruminococcus sp.]
MSEKTKNRMPDSVPSTEFISEYTEVKCKKCGKKYSDEIYYMAFCSDDHGIHYCPNCGRFIVYSEFTGTSSKN